MEIQYYCELCNTPVYSKFGSGRFCSRSCSNKWVALNQSNEAKKRKISKGMNNLIHNGRTYQERTCKSCGNKFNSDKHELCLDCRKDIPKKERKEFIYRKLLEYSKRNNGHVNEILKEVLIQFNSLSKNEEENIDNLCKIISNKNLRELSNETQFTFSNLKASFIEAGIPITIKKCSTNHLNIKEIIEELLNTQTVTEKTIKISENWYSIDEYYEESKIAFEIDGKWCHNKQKDEVRDLALASVGIKTIRIPSDFNKEDIRELFIENRLITD